MIKIKSSQVKFTELTPVLAFILNHLTDFHYNKMSPQPEDLIITSINDGNHSVNSRHYTNEALDLRSRNFESEEQKLIFKSRLETFLGPKFVVLYEGQGTENEHFHIQIKKDMTFP